MAFNGFFLAAIDVKKSSKPRTLQDTFNDLLSNIQKPLGIHHIRTLLFSLPVNYLKDLRDFGLDKGGVDPFSPKYRLSSIICDVASFRLFKPVRSEPLHDNNRKFLHIIPIHYLTYWRSAFPTTNSEIWMATGIKYLSVRKFLGMCRPA